MAGGIASLQTAPPYDRNAHRSLDRRIAPGARVKRILAERESASSDSVVTMTRSFWVRL